MGGEPSNAWNWAWQLSRYHRVWILAHPHDREGIEQFLASHPNPMVARELPGPVPCIAGLATKPRATGKTYDQNVHLRPWL
jgi:hypothetical protein